MIIGELKNLYAKSPNVAALVRELSKKSRKPVFCEGLRGSASAFFFATLLERNIPAKPYIFILNDEDEAGYFYQDMAKLADEDHILFYPSAYKRAVKYAQRDPANEILRTEVLERISGKVESPLFIVTHPVALTEKVLPGNTINDHLVALKVGDSLDLTELAKRLSEIGFRRTDYVYEPGEFAVRGSILDVYSYDSGLPYRIDFFGDDIESIRTFEVQSQLSSEKMNEVKLIAAIASEPHAGVPFSDVVPDETVIFVKDLALIDNTFRRVYNEGFSRQAALSRDEGETELDKEMLLADPDTLMNKLFALQRVEFGLKPFSESSSRLKFSVQPQPVYHKDYDLLFHSLSDFITSGYHIYMLADGEKQNERLRNILSEKAKADFMQVDFTPVSATVHEGFSDGDLKVCCFTDHQIFDRYHKYTLKNEKARNGKMALTLKELRQFSVGDYVVHVDHGVGRFGGLIRMPGSDGTMHETIKINYLNNDVIYVSIHALYKISKYRGQDGVPPKMNKLGGRAWENLKEKTKKKIKDIARDLIKLYSERREAEGFAFSGDNYLQHELEAAFTYEDTPDQLRVTNEVKADMERRQPMDRLVCGDVGFGKTEIAIRAAFKAACDSKQTAVLVPTTVLALQHYKTFSERLKDFPVRVDYLSRARTAKQTTEILNDLKSGKIDILIGTHRLIGKSVKFKDLGLLVIDEEQKFGVAVKEKLRQMKVNVDTLTMSATPIPRTLQFSLMGARDFSMIQTPPPNRRPVRTEIHSFDHEVIAEAVNFEMSRGGQVFIVTNRIAALPNIKMLLQKYVPDARVAIGHGQMPPEALEKTVLGFINYEYDVLLSTTIVENGVDIPNANTIIIDAAHTFGLSDLHQMRGRVGRSNRQAFCYLLAPPMSLLKDDARRRLQAVESFSDLGSGISIAMQDLEIRGAGNLLGGEQSGFIADLGYETYHKILSQAVTELKNDEFAELYADQAATNVEIAAELFVDDCNIECDYHAYFPETYVPGAAERMLLYRELDNLSKDEELEAFRQRMNDRFGPLPTEGEELLKIVSLRRLGRLCGVERLILKNGKMTMYFVQNKDSIFYRSNAFNSIIDYAMSNVKRCKLDEHAGKRLMLVKNVPTVAQAVIVLKSILGK